ncbi:hypothetical protein PILCRDRAFT_812781 [Piloderma croceum F 1598]|uniref:Uncharacterized protein n=1 Tax=Piloderma croceum (strain F 1598) TaxID=765440 RepID=A0A0C3GH81_PILCF|nr:hypothetical protein PILCRDRAFT_812781 [Piloderma croceum F 1598]
MHTRADLLSQVAALDTAISCAELEYKQAINMLAPVSSVPNELLSMIFQAGYESSSFPFEIIVSQVTRLWRRVAVNTPQLWTRIYVGRVHAGYFMAETYLSRSGALPLDLHIDMYSGHTNMAEIILACKIFHSDASRWRRLKVHLVWWQGLVRLLESLASANVPSLQSLQIYFDYDVSDDTDVIAHSIFTGGAPSLASLKLHGFGLDCCLPPLTMLNTLEIHHPLRGDRISLACLASMLDGLPLLTHLVINGDFIHGWTPDTQINLPSLRSFHLNTYNEIDQIPGLLNAIAAPLLHTLLLESVICDEIDAFAESWCPTLQTPKYPSLRSLALFTTSSHPIQADAWPNIFRVFPSITHFSLSHWEWELFSKSLLEPEEPADIPIWPGLDTVILVTAHDAGAFPPLLRETIPLLIASGYPIRKLQLSQNMITAMADDLTHLGTQVEVTADTLHDKPPFVCWDADDD